MNNIKIRFAEEKDLSALVGMQVEFEKFFHNIGCDAYEINRKDREKDIYDINFSEKSFVRTLIVEVNNNIAGKISFYKGYTAEVPPYFNFHLSGVYIHEQYREMGLSKILFNKLIEIAKSEKIKQLKWSVWGKNKHAYYVYKKMGAKNFAEDDDEHFMYLNI